MATRRLFSSIVLFTLAACGGQPPLPPPPVETASNADKCHVLMDTVCAVADGCRVAIADNVGIAINPETCKAFVPRDKVCDNGVSDGDYRRLNSCVQWMRDLYEARATWSVGGKELHACDAVAGVVDAIIHHDGAGLPPDCLYFKDRIK